MVSEADFKQLWDKIEEIHQRGQKAFGEEYNELNVLVVPKKQATQSASMGIVGAFLRLIILWAGLSGQMIIQLGIGWRKLGICPDIAPISMRFPCWLCLLVFTWSSHPQLRLIKIMRYGFILRTTTSIKA